VIEIGLLGPVTIKVDGRSLVPPASQKGRALLGQLALGAQPISRELLAETFWPDTSRRSALASLSTELAKLRTALGHAGDRIARHRRRT
jgi:DNA-binding SARP family transcriptional activator